MLIQRKYIRRVRNIFISDLGYVHQSVLFHANIHEGSEVRQISHDTRNNHPDLQIVDRMNVVSKTEYFSHGTGITPRFLEFIHDVFQRG